MFANMQTFISGGKAGNEKNSFFAYICYRKHIWNIEMRVKPYERMWKVIVIALIVKVHEPVWIVQQKKPVRTQYQIIQVPTKNIAC